MFIAIETFLKAKNISTSILVKKRKKVMEGIE